MKDEQTELWIAACAHRLHQHWHAVHADELDAVTMSAPYDVDGANPLAQAYDYIKTLPAFADANDI